MAEGGFEEDWVGESGREDGWVAGGTNEEDWVAVGDWTGGGVSGWPFFNSEEVDIAESRRSLGGMLTQELHWEFRGKIPQALKPP